MILYRSAQVCQAPLIQCPVHDPPPSLTDVLFLPEIDIGGPQIAQALVILPIVVIGDGGFDLSLQVAGQEVVLKQDPVLQCLMPALARIAHRSCDEGLSS